VSFVPRPSPRVAAAALLLGIAGAACGPISVLPTPTPEPTPIPTASPTPKPPDLEPPTVVGRDPLPNGELATDGSVRVTFSEPVSGIDRASFQLGDVTGAVLVAAVTLDAGGRVATLVPTAAKVSSRRSGMVSTVGPVSSR